MGTFGSPQKGRLPEKIVTACLFVAKGLSSLSTCSSGLCSLQGALCNHSAQRETQCHRESQDGFRCQGPQLLCWC